MTAAIDTLMQISLAIARIGMTAIIIVCLAVIVITVWEMVFDE